ncbi:tyrosine-type recombinase/integrase [Nocardioides sp. dk4132]|uniref:tyrosine-type recombinase/integrase n=1 Tax=unclassified Nocardioides TaxID=2615069 RepID=UPI003A4C6866
MRQNWWQATSPIRPPYRSPSQSSASSRHAEVSAPLGHSFCDPTTDNPIDRRDAYRMVARIARVAGISRHIRPHSLRHAAITNALDAGVPPRCTDLGPPRGSPHHRALRPCPWEPRRSRRPLPNAYVAGV